MAREPLNKCQKLRGTGAWAGKAALAGNVGTFSRAPTQPSARVTVRLFSERSLARIEADLGASERLKDQSNVIFNHAVVAPYLNLLESPNAADFIEGFNQAAKEEIEQQEERNRQVIEKVLRPYRDQLQDSDLSIRQLSDFVQRSSSAAKHSATDLKHLRVLLNTLTQMVLRTLNC